MFHHVPWTKDGGRGKSMIRVKMEITWKSGKIKSERVKWQFIGQIGQHSIKKKKDPKEIFLELKGMHFICIKFHSLENSHFLKA